MRTNPAWALALVLCAFSLISTAARAETPPPAPPTAPAPPDAPPANPAPVVAPAPSDLGGHPVEAEPTTWNAREALKLADPEQSNKTMAELGIVPASGSKLPELPAGLCTPHFGPFWTTYTGPGCTKEQTDGPTPLAIILAALAVMVMATVPAVVVLKRKRKAETQSRPTLPTKPRE